MIRNGDAAVHNLTPKPVRHFTCIDCGVEFARKGASIRCKPHAADHYDRERLRRHKEKMARKRAEGAVNAK